MLFENFTKSLFGFDPRSMRQTTGELRRDSCLIVQEKSHLKPPGLHSEQINLEGLTSGTYIYEVELNNTWRQQSTMMLIK